MTPEEQSEEWVEENCEDQCIDICLTIEKMVRKAFTDGMNAVLENPIDYGLIPMEDAAEYVQDRTPRR